ncbi:MAG: DUF1364 family protein [Pseudomonadota bacterium]|nr:DUF1364 family protein [Pseudomonadota bacterium]
MNYRNNRIRQAARHEQCTLRFPCCDYGTDTTVWCHSNLLEDGHGTGIKAHDHCGCFGCVSCHDVLDRRIFLEGWSNQEILNRFHQAMKKSWLVLLEKGVLK